MVNNLLGNDLVINEDACNLSCKYCLTGQSNLKEGHNLKLIFEPPKRDDYGKDTPLGHNVDAVADRMRTTFNMPMLKVTGGEIFLVKGIMDFLEQEAAKHEVLIVQTNGVLVREQDLARLRSWGNVVLQVSLDSHLYTGNSYRVQSEKLHNKTMAAIERILLSGIPVEIYQVLHDRSVAETTEFARYLAEFGEHVSLHPFPVRGPDSDDYKIRPDEVKHIEKLVDSFDELSAVLPPRAYFDRLLSFYHEGKRTFRCHLPRLVISTFSDGVVTPCPNVWFSDMGNVLDKNWTKTTDRIGETGLTQALLAETPRLDACHGCFTPWDTLSMYFENEISLDELCSAPTYSPPAIRKRLAEMKYEYDKAHSE